MNLTEAMNATQSLQLQSSLAAAVEDRRSLPGASR
jgi:hypothetical protein